jgi:hypothetical protein
MLALILIGLRVRCGILGRLVQLSLDSYPEFGHISAVKYLLIITFIRNTVSDKTNTTLICHQS